MERVSVGIGRIGLRELIEPELRRIVAELLAVPEECLKPDVSLVQDLAADSLDLTEVVVEAEGRFDVTIPEAAIDQIRTYGDLLDVVIVARMHEPTRPAAAVFVRATVLPAAREEGCGAVTRSAWLAPYAVETIADDARRAGPGARLELTVPASAPLAVIERVEQSFGHLVSHGVTVDVRQEQVGQRRAVA